jgi:glycosyltransferase involved in cell wall biosynthesis
MAFKPDVIIVLFMNKYLNYMDLYEIQKSTNAPIYLYMMDMAIMTGGCHYSWDCKGYYKSCGSCPGLNSNKIKDQTWKNMQINKSCVERMQIFPIAASNNLFEQLENSSLFKHKERYKVILPVNSRHFNVSQKSIARSILNIPQNKKIIFFGAVSITERRKGFLELLNILENLYNIIDDKDKYHIIIAGQSDASIMQSIPFSCSHLGNLSYEQLPLAYQSSNIFVCPSIQDSGPMMINQSITCGIPVVSFNIGVSKDLIINGETGYIIPLGDTTGFANSIKKILDLSSEDEVIMSQNCRRVGVEQCETEVFVNNIINIIR